MQTRPQIALGWLYQPTTQGSQEQLQHPACHESSVLQIQHWSLVPAGMVSNELINNSLVMNPVPHSEPPTEHERGFKRCESAKGSLELNKNCNCMELGEQDKLIKSFH